jgi:SAM-dependent methyltransferase
MIKSIRKSALGSAFEGVARRLLKRPKIEFESSSQYWDLRYQLNGSSGAGSYGRLAKLKADVLNEFVEKNNVQSVIEFGCGDGNQLSLAKYPSYIGVDVSPTIIERCKKRFSGDAGKSFIRSIDYTGEKAELSLSLDVIYHLVEDHVFEEYMRDLFSAAEKFVIIYSSNYDEDLYNATHVKHRRFTDWVGTRVPNFRLIQKISNAYPYNRMDPDNTSLADFFVYESE